MGEEDDDVIEVVVVAVVVIVVDPAMVVVAVAVKLDVAAADAVAHAICCRAPMGVRCVAGNGT